MAVQVVTWNLNGEGAHYAARRQALFQRLSNYAFHIEPDLETVAWVHTEQTSAVLSEHLRLALDANDKLFVSRVFADNYWGWLGEDTWAWIAARL